MINRELIKKLASQLKKDGVSALLVAPSSDLIFLLGHKPYLCERFQALVVTDKEETFYICNRLTEAEAIGFMDGDKVYQWMDSDGFTGVSLPARGPTGSLDAGTRPLLVAHALVRAIFITPQ